MVLLYDEGARGKLRALAGLLPGIERASGRGIQSVAFCCSFPQNGKEAV